MYTQQQQKSQRPTPRYAHNAQGEWFGDSLMSSQQSASDRKTYAPAERGAQHVTLRNVPKRTINVIRVIAKERGQSMMRVMIDALNAYAAQYHD